MGYVRWMLADLPREIVSATAGEAPETTRALFQKQPQYVDSKASASQYFTLFKACRCAFPYQTVLTFSCLTPACRSRYLTRPFGHLLPGEMTCLYEAFLDRTCMLGPPLKRESCGGWYLDGVSRGHELDCHAD